MPSVRGPPNPHSSPGGDRFIDQIIRCDEDLVLENLGNVDVGEHVGVSALALAVSVTPLRIVPGTQPPAREVRRWSKLGLGHGGGGSRVGEESVLPELSTPVGVVLSYPAAPAWRTIAARDAAPLGPVVLGGDSVWSSRVPPPRSAARGRPPLVSRSGVSALSPVLIDLRVAARLL